MFKHALKDIYIGKNSGQLLDPSDIEFSFYSYGRHLDENGEFAKPPSYELVTYTYDKCYYHSINVQDISEPEDINIAKVYLLCTELCGVVTSICQNSNIIEDEYIEFLFNQMNNLINKGYAILSQYYAEVEKNGEKKL